MLLHGPDHRSQLDGFGTGAENHEYLHLGAQRSSLASAPVIERRPTRATVIRATALDVPSGAR